jgi:hypothetical protein
VIAVPYGSQGTVQGSASRAVPVPYGGPSQGVAIPVLPQGGAARTPIGRPGGALQPAPQPAPPAAKDLRRVRCGTGTLVCEAGSTAMCEGKPVACN